MTLVLQSVRRIPIIFKRVITSRNFVSSDYVLIYEFDMFMRSDYMVKFSESLSSYEIYMSHA